MLSPSTIMAKIMCDVVISLAWSLVLSRNDRRYIFVVCCNMGMSLSSLYLKGSDCWLISDSIRVLRLDRSRPNDSSIFTAEHSS